MTSTSASKKDSILIVAAEASSCMYAKSFIRQWKALFPDDEFFGVGDREMQQMGMECLGFAEDLAVVGLLEVFKHRKKIFPCFRALESESKARSPKFALLLDYPGFNLRLAKSLKTMDIPVVYYISPQLWAWKKGRVSQIKKNIDEMLVVFPFEVDFYKKYGVQAHFVGHPLVEVVEKEISSFNPSEGRAGPVLGLMPGSRKSEIQYNLLNQLRAAEKLKAQQPDLKVKILLAPTLKPEDLESILSKTDLALSIESDAPTKMILSCDLILTASGTATLQVALCEKPMVVMYRMNPVTAFLAKLLVRTVDSFCIVNLIAGHKVVPELFQEQANPEDMAQALNGILNDDKIRAEMLTGILDVKKKLGKGGATANVVQFLNRRFKSS